MIQKYFLIHLLFTCTVLLCLKKNKNKKEHKKKKQKKRKKRKKRKTKKKRKRISVTTVFGKWYCV